MLPEVCALFQMYTAQSKEDILGTLDSYTHGIKCLPRDWDADHKIEPPPAPPKKLGDELEEIDEDRREVMFDIISLFKCIPYYPK